MVTTNRPNTNGNTIMEDPRSPGTKSAGYVLPFTGPGSGSCRAPLLGRGECDHRVGDATIHLEAGSLLRIPANAVHCAVNTGWEPVRMVIVYSAPDRETVFLE